MVSKQARVHAQGTFERRFPPQHHHKGTMLGKITAFHSLNVMCAPAMSAVKSWSAEMDDGAESAASGSWCGER